MAKKVKKKWTFNIGLFGPSRRRMRRQRRSFLDGAVLLLILSLMCLFLLVYIMENIKLAFTKTVVRADRFTLGPQNPVDQKKKKDDDTLMGPFTKMFR